MSLLLEIVFSVLLAPIRMLFHTQFVLAALTGLGVLWKSPPREDAETTWGEASGVMARRPARRRLGRGRLLAGVALRVADASARGGPAHAFDPDLRLLEPRVPRPVAAPRWGCCGSPRKRILRPSCAPRGPSSVSADAAPGFVEAVVNPQVNAMVCATSCSQVRRSPRAQRRRDRAIAAVIGSDPQALTDDQMLFFLVDPLALSQLHLEVWTAAAAHPHWIAACRGDHTELRKAS